MFEQILEGVTLGTVVPASLVIFCALLYLTKNKNKKQPKRIIDEKKLNAHLLAFKPEPMIDYDKYNKNNGIVETSVPDETVPGCMNLVKKNYLNFLNNESFKKEAELCIRHYGVGSCGPRGFYGTIDVHLTLESRLAKFMDMEEAVLYSYGFSTISSAIGAYCRKSDIIFCDEKISFAAGQGLLAARSKVEYFKHNDVQDLELKLKEYEKKENQKKEPFRKFLIVEGIYAATGTICPLPKLMELREKYKLRIFIDESISFGVLGKNGKGVTEHFNIDRSNVDMIMGSLEGSVSSIGGFCVGQSFVIEHQRLSGLGYCYSASLPPFLSHVAVLALDAFESDPDLFENLKSVSISVDEQLRSLEEYMVLSDPLSPLKVITIKYIENRAKNIKKIHTFCAEQNIYMISCDEDLQFNVNITLDKAEICNIINVLKDAVANITMHS